MRAGINKEGRKEEKIITQAEELCVEIFFLMLACSHILFEHIHSSGPTLKTY
jgi:hypothetical protein